MVKNLQYFVIAILVALSYFAVKYTLEGYNPLIDGASFWNFLTSTFLIQFLLLVASIMLHVWLIRHAEEIAEMFAFFKYKSDRWALTKKIEQYEQESIKRYLPEFTQRTHKLAQSINTFKSDHPDVKVNFEEFMSNDLMNAMNTVMGRKVFAIGSENVV